MNRNDLLLVIAIINAVIFVGMFVYIASRIKKDNGVSGMNMFILILNMASALICYGVYIK